MGTKVIEMLKGEGLYRLGSKEKTYTNKCACSLNIYSASGALTTDSNLPLCEASQ